jgi:hypothetical protein
MLKKLVLLFIVCASTCCGTICHASIKVEIEKPGFKVSAENPTAEEVLVISNLQKDQLIADLLVKSVDQGFKGCNKKSLLEKIFGKK